MTDELTMDSSAAAPAAAFAAGAGAGLSAVSGQLTGLQSAVASGALTLTQEAALALLGSIGQLQDQASDLANDAGKLDQPLHFGHSWVGQAMDAKFRAVAVGAPSSVRPVLTEFATLLGGVRATIKAAAHLTNLTDEQLAALLNQVKES